MSRRRRAELVSRVIVSFRMTVYERAELQRLCAAAGATASDLLRGWIAGGEPDALIEDELGGERALLAAATE